MGLAMAAFFVCAAGISHAQDAARTEPAALTVVAEAELQPLAREVVRSLQRRGTEVTLGGEPLPVVEATLEHEVALVRGPTGAVRLVMGRAGGGTVSTVVEVPGAVGDAFPVTLAIEALQDQAAVPTPPPAAPRAPNAYVYYEYERPPV